MWNAQSVLIDEISRSKPEQQNRLFSLVHERKVQGIDLPRLRYRWAAMNPCSSDQDSEENYTGSEPLDPALADRFALFVHALDWRDLSDDERRRIAEPVGEGRIANDGGRLKTKLAEWRSAFVVALGACPELILDYVTTAVTALNTASIRVSPRRSRLLARSLLAAIVVAGEPSSRLFRLILEFEPSPSRMGRTGQEGGGCRGAPGRLGLRRAERGALDPQLHGRAGARPEARHPDRTLPEPRQRHAGGGAASCFRAARARGGLRLCDLSRRRLWQAADRRGGGERPWQGRDANPVCGRRDQLAGTHSQSGTVHPDLERFAEVIGRLTGGRAERARQFFNWCLVERVAVADPAGLESELDGCVELIRRVQPA